MSKRHKWVDVPRVSNEPKSFNFSPTKEHPEGVQINLNINFILDQTIRSLKRCLACNQESVNGKRPKFSCDEFLTREVLEK
jgi:hypothetical protein